jgi:hypothetical protein
MDESGCDKRIGFRKTGWSPLGIAPSQVAKFHHDQRYQILPAYAQDGVVLSRVFQGSTDASVFEDFIEELLHCGRWPEPKSVLVMDNAAFKLGENRANVLASRGQAGIFALVFARSESIEELFAELKAFIKRHWQAYADDPAQGFDTFLCCVDTVGRRKQSAEGHSRNSGLTIEEL